MPVHTEMHFFSLYLIHFRAIFWVTRNSCDFVEEWMVSIVDEDVKVVDGEVAISVSKNIPDKGLIWLPSPEVY